MLPTRHLFPSLMLAALLVLSGCAATRPSAATRDPGRTLEEVNRHLVLAPPVTLVRSDGEPIQFARRVRVGPVTTDYETWDGLARALPTSEIVRIERRTRPGAGGRAGRGALIGATPGLSLGLYAAVRPCRGEDMGCGIGNAIGMVMGAGIAVLGGFAGAAIGTYSTTQLVTVLYEGPVSRYLPPESE
jgi:hypothetical protein